MRVTRVLLVSVLVAALAGTAVAQVKPTAPFTGAQSDSYESLPFGQFVQQLPVFNKSIVRSLSGPNMHVTGTWYFTGVVSARTGTHFMGGAGCNYEFVLDEPALKFGGYWATNANLAGATAKLYDKADNLLGEFPVGAPISQWQWDGWEVLSGPGIMRVQILAKNQYGGYIMSDDIEFTPIPEPATLGLLALGLLLRRR